MIFKHFCTYQDHQRLMLVSQKFLEDKFCIMYQVIIKKTLKNIYIYEQNVNVSLFYM